MSLPTGTGSGKSLGYIVPIVDAVLRQHAEGSYRLGVKAIIVYPMNAPANSQVHPSDGLAHTLNDTVTGPQRTLIDPYPVALPLKPSGQGTRQRLVGPVVADEGTDLRVIHRHPSLSRLVSVTATGSTHSNRRDGAR